ncbi:MAG TPA: GH25 family lysozyme [Mobilitalea sp.]|nr:GH25 family lysozyme [Mobilitalea sp.]
MKNVSKVIIFIFIILCLMLLFIYRKIIFINHPPKERYPISGIDVSHYQGEIDWNILASQDVDFAFIKATEGSSFVDEYFKQNWNNASDTSIILGAYHFFSFESSAETQADNYIKTVGSLSGKLPPVIDFEFYRNYANNPPDMNSTRTELHDLLDILEKHYGVKPIIYTTVKTYYKYIKDEFYDYPLWIRNVYYSPNIGMANKWVFWQYTDRATLLGYSGSEKYIDMNVYHGTEEDFKSLILK